MYQNHLTLNILILKYHFLFILELRRQSKNDTDKKYSNGRGSTFYFMLLIINRDRV